MSFERALLTPGMARIITRGGAQPDACGPGLSTIDVTRVWQRAHVFVASADARQPHGLFLARLA